MKLDDCIPKEKFQKYLGTTESWSKKIKSKHEYNKSVLVGPSKHS